MACVLCRPEDLCNPGLHRYGRQSCIGLRRQNRRHQDDNNGNGILEGQTSSQNLIVLHLFPSNSPSPGSLPGLHYNVERPNRNSTSRCEKFCFREFFSSACGFGAISPRLFLRSKDCRSVEAAFICGRAVQRRYRRLIEAQVHGQLSAVVGKMAEHRVGNHGLTRAVADDVFSDHKLPIR